MKNTSEPTFKFNRQTLAQTLAAEMQNMVLFGQLAVLPNSGTFLSAPRRIGKSTFLQADLAPLLREKGHEVVYADLWADQRREPADLLKEALIAALKAKAGRVRKATQALGLTKVTALASLSFDLNTAAGQENASLTQLLTQLADKSKTKKVVLIVDEAQQALATERGEAAMFALKAARDSLNANPAKPRLMLLCTGSSRSKLSGLVAWKTSPFYGAHVVDFPVMGAEFTQAYAAYLNPRLAESMQLDLDALNEAFVLLGHRPETFMQAAGVATTQALPEIGTVSQALLVQAKKIKGQMLGELQTQFDALPPVQQVLLLRILEDESHFAPYAKESLTAYAAYVGEPVSVTLVQSSLAALVDKDIVWLAKRGGYSVDDPLWAVWFESSTTRGG